MPTIKLEGIRKSFGPTKAADGLSLDVKDGEYLCVLGPTGAGKTTLLRIICGLTRQDKGKILLNDKEISHMEPEERGAVMLSQTYSLFPQLTVAENILFGPVIRGMGEEETERLLSDMLDLVRLTQRPDALPKELSGGMMQRTALARAMASGTEILLLDEPLRALDARLRISLRVELRSLAKSLGLTVIHVTHDQDEALVMADRIAVLREGRIIQVGTPRQVFDDPMSPFIANFVGQSNFFQGEVLSNSPHTRIRCPNGLELQGRSSDIDIGERAVLGVKIGNTDVHKEGEGFLEGTIERILFEGRNLFLDINVANIGRVSAKVPSWRSGKLAPGDVVKMKWSADSATVFRMPEHGLERELKVE